MRSDRLQSRDHEQNSRNGSSDVSEESHTDDRSSEAQNAAEGPMSDEQLAEILSKKRIRFGTCQRWVLSVYTGQPSCLP